MLIHLVVIVFNEKLSLISLLLLHLLLLPNRTTVVDIELNCSEDFLRPDDKRVVIKLFVSKVTTQKNDLSIQMKQKNNNNLHYNNFNVIVRSVVGFFVLKSNLFLLSNFRVLISFMSIF